MSPEPSTFEQMHRWCTFLFDESDERVRQELAEAQDSFDRALALLKDDIHTEPKRLHEEEGVESVSEIVRKMRFLVRHEGAILLKLFEKRVQSILIAQREREEQIFRRWDVWREGIVERSRMGG